MKRRAGALAFIATTAMLLLSGCGQGVPVNEDLTVEEAKAIAQQMERDIAAVVPEENVTDLVQNDTGVLMKCDDNGGYQWPAQTRV